MKSNTGFFIFEQKFEILKNIDVRLARRSCEMSGEVFLEMQVDVQSSEPSYMK